MKTNRGKGYFYAMGQSDKSLFAAARGASANVWPEWARTAYLHGFNGWAL